MNSKTYTFDRAFGPEATQEAIFDEVVSPILDEVLMGYNCTIFAYGKALFTNFLTVRRAGTGKTYTMEGDLESGNSFDAGIIPRSLRRIFRILEKEDSEYSVKISYVEIYNEELKDLLAPDDSPVKLKIFDGYQKKGTTIQGLEEVAVLNAEDVLNVLQKGANRRKVAATKMNEVSRYYTNCGKFNMASRSHSIFTVTLHIREATPDGEDLLKIGKLNLVDLAGSENIGRSGAENRRAKEAGMINQSLLTLGRVINALVDKGAHIPYRESKLTRLLQDSLVSPARSNLEESLSTLDYAHRAKNIRNKPEINQKMTRKALLRDYEAQIEQLKLDLQVAREKNGIFLAPERFESLVSESESRKGQIEETQKVILLKEAQLQSLQSDLALQLELLQRTKVQLEQANDEIAQKNASLVEARELLETTSKNLKEQEVLTRFEIILTNLTFSKRPSIYGDAATVFVIRTSKYVEPNGRRERNTAIEQENRRMFEDFQELLVEELGTIQNSVASSIQSQLQLNDRLVANVTETLSNQRELKKANGFFSNAKESLRSLSSAISEADSTRHNQTENLKKSVAELKEAFGKAEADFTIQFKENAAEGSEALQALSTIVAGHADETLLSGFVTMQKEKVTSMQQKLVSEIEELKRDNGRLQSLIKEQKQLRAKRKQDLLHLLTSSIDTYFNEEDSTHETLRSSAESIMQSRMDCIKGLHATAEKDISELEGMSAEITSDISSRTKQLDDTAGESASAASARMAEITKAFKKTRKVLNAYDSNCKRSESITAAVSNELQRQGSNIDGYEEYAIESLQHYEKQIQREMHNIFQTNEQHSDDLQSKLSGLRDHIQCRNLAYDRPTGKTPRRKRIDVPKDLVRTREHEDILEELRATGRVDNFTLPADPFSFLKTRPFLQYYGAVFLMFELSTPFLNIHYFCDKFGYTGTTLQLVNGIILLIMFFGARLCFGFYWSYQFYGNGVFPDMADPGAVSMFANMDRVPRHLFLIYGIANVLLNSLNVFWFYKMILSVAKRFRPKAKAKKQPPNINLNDIALQPHSCSDLVKFLSTTVGRDRINRFVQYFARYLAWQLQRNGADKDTIARLAKLQAAVGLTRKVMRTGRQVEFYRTITKSLAVKDKVTRYTAVGKNLFLSLWLALDTVQWLHTAGVYHFETIKDVGRRAFKFWLIALTFSFIGDLHKLRINAIRLGIEQKAVKFAASKREKDDSAEKSIKVLKAERSKLLLATAQDGLDILIPASGLEYVKLETGIVGLVGAITAIMGGCNRETEAIAMGVTNILFYPEVVEEEGAPCHYDIGGHIQGVLRVTLSQLIKKVTITVSVKATSKIGWTDDTSHFHDYIQNDTVLEHTVHDGPLLKGDHGFPLDLVLGDHLKKLRPSLAPTNQPTTKASIGAVHTPAGGTPSGGTPNTSTSNLVSASATPAAPGSTNPSLLTSTKAFASLEHFLVLTATWNGGTFTDVSKSTELPIVIRESVESRCKVLGKPSSLFLSNIWGEMVPGSGVASKKSSSYYDAGELRYEMSIPRRSVFPGDTISLAIAVRPKPSENGKSPKQRIIGVGLSLRAITEVSPPTHMNHAKPTKMVEGLKATKYLNTLVFEDPAMWATQPTPDPNVSTASLEELGPPPSPLIASTSSNTAAPLIPKVATQTLTILIPPDCQPTHLWTGAAAYRHVISVAVFTDGKGAPDAVVVPPSMLPSDPETAKPSLIVEFPIFILSLGMPNYKRAVPVVPRIPRPVNPPPQRIIAFIPPPKAKSAAPKSAGPPPTPTPTTTETSKPLPTPEPSTQPSGTTATAPTPSTAAEKPEDNIPSVTASGDASSTPTVADPTPAIPATPERAPSAEATLSPAVIDVGIATPAPVPSIPLEKKESVPQGFELVKEEEGESALSPRLSVAIDKRLILEDDVPASPGSPGGGPRSPKVDLRIKALNDPGVVWVPCTGKYVAMYNYRAADSEEIDLEAGDLITMQSSAENGWGYGLNESKEVAGYLPMYLLCEELDRTISLSDSVGHQMGDIISTSLNHQITPTSDWRSLCHHEQRFRVRYGLLINRAPDTGAISLPPTAAASNATVAAAKPAARPVARPARAPAASTPKAKLGAESSADAPARPARGRRTPKDSAAEKADGKPAKTGPRDSASRSPKGGDEAGLTKRVLHIRRVARTTSGGKIRSISALVVVGNGNGLGGYGEGRASDITNAVTKAEKAAIKNMVAIDRFQQRTIFSDITHKFHCVDLTLRSAPPGYGIVANRNIHEICRCLGIRDLSAKVRGSRNPMNVIKGTFEALQRQKTPEQLARLRGRKVQDIARIYYGVAQV
ncbi:kinesin motor protein cin8 [Phlyctochytrium bullatum]|nr:kinesin motor protein cin8 [Phlyctochytrium bullatum]